MLCVQREANQSFTKLRAEYWHHYYRTSEHPLVTVAGVIRKGFIERVNLEIHLQGEENIYTEFAKKQDAKGEF